MRVRNHLVCHVSKTPANVHKQIKLYKLIQTVFLILSVLLLALVVLVGKFALSEGRYYSTGYYRNYIEEFPFYCEDLSLSPDEDFETFDIKANTFEYFIQRDRYVCSFRNLSDVLQKFVERIGRQRLAKGLEGQRYLQCGNINLKPPSGYLSASFTKVSKHQHYTDKGLHHIIHWDKHPDTALIARRLEYRRGEIKVPEGRFYYTYASVHVNVSKTSAPNTKVSLRVCARGSSYGYERTLLRKSVVYDTTERNVVSSLNVGSHVFLSKNENVYVKLSNAETLIHESAGNTFGIFPLR